MRRAGLVVAEALAAVRERATPGVTTGAARRGRGARSSRTTARRRRSWATTGTRRRSASRSTTRSCTASRAPGCWQPGDVVSIDCGAIVDGWHGDSAITVVLDGAGAATTSTWRPRRPSAAMWAGIAALAAAERLGAVGEAVEDVVDAAAGGRPERRRAVRDRRGVRRPRDRHRRCTSRRTSRTTARRDRGPRVRPGLCVAVEPMVVRGQRFTQVLDDDWTVVTPTARARRTGSTRSPSWRTASGC